MINISFLASLLPAFSEVIHLFSFCPPKLTSAINVNKKGKKKKKKSWVVRPKHLPTSRPNHLTKWMQKQFP